MQKFQRSMPVLAVEDLAEALTFWTEKLGFETGGVWGEPPCFAIVGRDTITVALDRPEQVSANASSGWSAYLYIADVDGYAEQLKARGVDFLYPPEDAPYGCRDFTIETPGGHRIAFGTDLRPGPEGPGL